MLDDYSLRRAQLADVETIAHHRAAMFREMGEVSGNEVGRLETAAFIHLRQMIAERRYVGWLIEHSSTIVAGGGLVISQLLPRPGALDGGATALIVNVYTEPRHRRHGLARRLMKTALEWCREHHITDIRLHASAEGRLLYESLGFVPTNEMRCAAGQGRKF